MRKTDFIETGMTNEELFEEQKAFYNELKHLMESNSSENSKYLEKFELLQFTGMFFAIYIESKWEYQVTFFESSLIWVLKLLLHIY